MSPSDPMLRFVGVPADSDPLVLLGLSPDACSGPVVDAALVSRLARIYDHPDGRSEMAEEARSILRAAAEQLKDDQMRAEVLRQHLPAADRASSTMPDDAARPRTKTGDAVAMTPLQRQVLQVLASSGGWNAMARARLASIGSMHGLSAGELVDQLRSLSTMSGRHSGGVIQRLPAHDAASRRAMEPGFVERVVVQYAPELRSSDKRSIVKLSLLFGGIGVLLLVLMYRFLFFDGASEPVVAAGAGDADTRLAAPMLEPGGSVSSVQSAVPLIEFTPSSMLSLKQLPSLVLDDVDASPGTIRSLATMARRAVGMEQVDAAFEASWDSAIQVASTSWFAADPSTARGLRRALVGVLEVAGTNPRLTGPLIGSLATTKPEMTADAIELPRGAWRYGMVGLIASSETVSPAARLLAAEYMRNTVGVEAESGTFQQGANAWLAACIPSMIEGLVVRVDPEQAWRYWCLCVGTIDDAAARHRTVLAAVRALLETELDLSRPELPQRVLTRLLGELDWSDHATIQPAVLGWFDDPAIGSTDIWVVSSTLASIPQTAWFTRSLVPPSDADLPMRRRIKDRVRAAWPRPDQAAEYADLGIPDGFDPQLAATWLTLQRQVRGIARERGSVPMLKRLLMERLLAEAADALVHNGGEGTLAALNDIESVLELLDEPVSGSGSSGAGGGIQGRADGQWARLYSLRGRTRADKIDMFQELENQSGNDLGPIDADVLAREALTASLAVREAAQYLIETRFGLAPNVAQALVDRVPEAARSVDVSGLIESISGTTLPRANSTRWPIEARIALVNHALSLRLNSAGEIDAISDAVARSLRREAVRLGRAAEPGANPEQSARSLVAAWEDRFASGLVRDDWPWGVQWRDRRTARRMLAGDALQRFLVEQIALHELLAHVVGTVQPDDATLVGQMQDELSLRRDRAVHILEQLLLVESGIVELWSVRIRHLLDVLDEQGFGGGS